MQVNRESAERVCDEKIAEWLANRKKHAAHKRKRNRGSGKSSNAPWITKMSARNSPMKECNTPKRSTNSLRRGRSAGAIQDSHIFSPLAPSMTRKPTKPTKIKKKKTIIEVLPCSFVLFCPV